MNLKRYRINSPTMALFPENGYHGARPVPAGSVVVIDEDLFKDNNKLVEVLWNQRNVMMFAQDLRTRGEKIDG